MKPDDVRLQRLVVIGNGMAGVRTLEELLKLTNELYDITVFGAEPHPNYNRILLSPVLAGEQQFEEIVLNDLDWYAENGIRLMLKRKVVKIDRARRRVIADDGSEAEYDRLLIATGSNPFILPIPGNDLQGVIGYRDIADTQVMMETAKTHKHAVVIGGGLLGLEAANGLKLRGMDVTVVHIGDWLMERQLDKTAGTLLQSALESRGLKFLLPKQTAELIGNDEGRVKAVRFADGEVIPADLVVMAAGIRPNSELAEQAVEGFPSCPIPEIARLGRTLKQWKDAFLAYFDTGRASNGGTEAVNGLIELHRRIARGFRNREHYRLRMLLIGGGLAHPHLR